MNIGTIGNTATQLFQSAQHKADNAAHEIATLSVSKDEVGATENSSNDIFKPIQSLKEAEQETAAASHMLNSEGEMIGSLINTTA